MDIDRIQRVLLEQGLDGWLFADHHGRDAIARRVLATPSVSHATRQWYYFIPATGEPRGLVSVVEPEVLDGLPGTLDRYNGWRSQRERLWDLLGGSSRVAMQYSPGGRIPSVSTIDGGTVDLVRAAGVSVASSVSLVQLFDSRVTEAQIEKHVEAGRKIDAIRRAAFVHIAGALRDGRIVTEWSLVEHVRTAMARERLVTSGGPLVAVNEHISLPHYQPSWEHDSPIRAGDIVLVDIWGKLEDEDAVYYDSAWMGYCGASAPGMYDRLFDIVTSARDAAFSFVSEGVSRRRPMKGAEVDQVARELIRANGYEHAFVHRLGHSLGRDVHGSGANLDSVEAHDDRELLPDTLYAIEPGIYLPQFGVRSEYDIVVTDGSATITGEVQHALLHLD